MFKKGDKVIALESIDGLINKDATGICNKDQYDTEYVEVKWDDFDQGWGAGKACWNVENKYIKLYQESIKTLNKDTVKVGQKIRVIADSAGELGFEHDFNNQRHSKDYTGTITSIDGVTSYHSEHKWVHLDNASSAICTMLLELLEEPKSESKDVIEYVECIKGYNTDLSIKDFNVVGKIYEVESYNPKTELLKLKGFSGIIASIKFDGNSGRLATDYKISTKAKFDLQNQLEVEENLVGRFIRANNQINVLNKGDYDLITSTDGDYFKCEKSLTWNKKRIGTEFELMPLGFTPESKESSEEFKVGDWVTILRGTSNWSSGMDRYVGKTVQITVYNSYDDTHNNVIRFKDDGGWTWETTNKHYRKATPLEIHEAQKLERDEYISQAVEKLEVPYPKTSYKNFKECYTKLPIVTSVKRSNIVPLKLEKQKSLINLPTI